jgi:hypothetical protein
MIDGSSHSYRELKLGRQSTLSYSSDNTERVYETRAKYSIIGLTKFDLVCSRNTSERFSA